MKDTLWRSQGWKLLENPIRGKRVWKSTRGGVAVCVDPRWHQYSRPEELHAGGQQKKCSKYFKKENHNHNPPKSPHPPIPKWKIIFLLIFQNIPNLLFLRTLELCNAPRSILINQRRSKQNISREKETDCLFFSSSSSWSSWWLSGDRPMPIDGNSKIWTKNDPGPRGDE